MRTGLTRRLKMQEAKSMPAHTCPVFSFVIESIEDAEAAERCSRENPDALVMQRFIIIPPERDAAGNITAPARDYRGPIISLEAI